ncbi:MAG: tetratricopeptide (TPR) repeat protein [Planctomycetota bacterium]|jgi:tetratricopeptide (TPR) repeat protein
MKNIHQISITLFFVTSLASCSAFSRPKGLAPGVECLSLSGMELRAPAIPQERRTKLEADLRSAEARHRANPKDENAAVWHGRRLAYLGRYHDAIEVYSLALRDNPQSYRLLRHRGHRYLTTRDLRAAISDLSQATFLARDVPDVYEQDGAPNKFDIPRSTLRSNIDYHLGLARYLEEDYDAAMEAWTRCLYFSRVNDDMFVATTYWTVLTLWRLDREEEADALLNEIHTEMDILENSGYQRLLLLFKGELSEDEILGELVPAKLNAATVGFGLGAWHQAHGRDEEAHELFTRVTAETFWPAFGFIAAEAELARGN